MASTAAKRKPQTSNSRHARPLFLPPTMEAVVVIKQICFATQMGRARIESMIRSGEFPAPDFKLNAADKKRRWTVELFNQWYRAHVKRSTDATE